MFIITITNKKNIEWRRMERRDPLGIVEDIADFLNEKQGLAIPPTQIAEKTKLNYQSCKQYLKLIDYIQDLPKIKKIKKHNGFLVMMEKDLNEYPEREQKRILKEEFGITPDESDKIYVGLLEKGATSENKAIELGMNPTIRKGIKFRHIAQTKEGKFYLTTLGQTIAKGSKKLFG